MPSVVFTPPAVYQIVLTAVSQPIAVVGPIQGPAGKDGADSIVPGPEGPASTVPGPAGATDHLLLTNIGTKTHAQIETDLDNLQPLDTDLTTLAGLTPTNNDTLVYTTGAWANRTMTQFKVTAALNNVSNTTDASKPVSTAQAAALALTLPLAGGTMTGQLASSSTSTGFALYNTADQTTNYERLRQYWNANTFVILSENGGTGTVRNIQIGTSGGTNLNINNAGSTSGYIQLASGKTVSGGGVDIVVSAPSLTNSSSINSVVKIAPTISQTSTAGYTALLINPTETTTGSGAKNLIDAQVGGVSKWKVRNDGVELPVQATTASAPAYVKGGIYFDTTLNKLRVGGATAWETVTSA